MTGLNETDHILRADDGANIHYRRHAVLSARGTLVFLHGAASNHTRWSEFLAHTRLTENWSTLRVDLRGHGRSVYRGRLTLRRWSDDLVQLLDAERCARAVVVGHSLGANIALDFARRHAPRVAALLLIDPARSETLHLPVPDALARVLLKLLATVVLAANALGVRRRALRELDLEQLDRRARALLAQHREADMERLYSSTREDLRYTAAAAYLQDIAAVLEPLPDPPPGIPVMLLLSAGRDPDALRLNRAYATRIAGCHTVEIQCNHWILTAAPDEARRAIEGWKFFGTG